MNGLRRAIVLVAAIAMIATTPDTASARALNAWLAAFDSGDRPTIQAFLQTNDPGALKRIDGLMDFRQRTGGFDLKNIESSTAMQTVALVEDRNNDQFARLTLAMDPAHPNQIATVSLEAIETPAAYLPQHMTQSELIAGAKAKLAADSDAGKFSGVAEIVVKGTPLFQQAYGMADRDTKTPNSLQTRFRIGSMNKMFTATSVLQLVQAGKVQLDAPLGTYLTDYPNKDVASKVTIRMLLSHTGGTGDIFTPEFDKHRLELKTLQDYEKLYGTRAPEYPPGSKYEYSNYGFILLGLVVEKVSGQSYYDYVHEHVYVPAGMLATASDPEDDAVPNRSIGYTTDDAGKVVPNTDTLPYRGTSAGGGYSTAGDLANFAAALQANKLLDAKYTAMLTTGTVKTGAGESYAFGFGDATVNGNRCFGHGGGAPGMNGDLQICPGPGYVVIVLSNLDPPAATRVSEWIANRIPLAP